MTSLSDELAPLRSALLREARSDADRVSAEAAADIDRHMREAEHRVAALREEARNSGQSQAEAAAVLQVTAAGREARRLVLAARHGAYLALRDAIRDRLDDAPRLRSAFVRRVRRVLGAGVTTTTVPGGVVGVSEDRRVECTIDGLAETALERLGVAVEEMWSP